MGSSYALVPVGWYDPDSALLCTLEAYETGVAFSSIVALCIVLSPIDCRDVVMFGGILHVLRPF